MKQLPQNHIYSVYINRNSLGDMKKKLNFKIKKNKKNLIK